MLISFEYQRLKLHSKAIIQILISFVNLQVFGLGNKTYEHYNKVAIYVDKRLEELGASRVYELGLGDDDAKYVKVNNCKAM